MPPLIVLCIFHTLSFCHSTTCSSPPLQPRSPPPSPDSPHPQLPRLLPLLLRYLYNLGHHRRQQAHHIHYYHDYYHFYFTASTTSVTIASTRPTTTTTTTITTTQHHPSTQSLIHLARPACIHSLTQRLTHILLQSPRAPSVHFNSLTHSSFTSRAQCALQLSLSQLLTHFPSRAQRAFSPPQP